MANYKEQSVAGSSYIRAREVHIDNPLDGLKRISFAEERVVNLGTGDNLVTPKPGMIHLGESFTQDNALTTFPLLDANGDPTAETRTYMDVYNILFSLYYHLAQQRDQQEQP